MMVYRGNPLRADDLTNKVLANPDRSFHVEVYDRITGDTYRVRVIRCEGRDVDFTMPITGYCAGELYQQTRKVLALLIPAWNIPHLALRRKPCRPWRSRGAATWNTRSETH